MDSFKGLFQALPRVGRWFQQGDIQPEDVRAFWRHMQRCFQTDAVHFSAPRGDWPRALAPDGGFRGACPVGASHRHVAVVGHCLHLPFEVGVRRAGWGLWRQVVACVHAHQHVLQYDEDGPAAAAYLTASSARARNEVDALRCDIELHFWRHGTTPSPWRLASRLRAQGCRAEDIARAGHVLALSAASIRQGAVENESSHVALQWLERHVPHLRWDRAYHPRAR
ncbi:hypothetical protein [Myxococcus sp. Y35]|uniref:hypothetical protein n=1 Tax=Pseudomyxococcus flavus TaxID=3115648 RepID=UPI003CF269B2